MLFITLSLHFQFLSMDQPPKDPPSSGIYLNGLYLHNAGWDANKQRVYRLPDGRDGPVPLPVVWLLPMDTLSLQKLVKTPEVTYKCPMYNSLDHLTEGNVVTFVNIKTGIDLQILKMRNVFITMSL